ncbi:MAG: sigma-54-dependent Fis family transcriptional regulator [Thermoguttaceae bacterium]|nr:sigma-54-dependent Fis family transcriptional regulator [Thermoguttaceae bacterium]
MSKSSEENAALTTAEEPLEVLVVDDEPAHAEVVAAALEKINAVCVVVHSQREALDAIKRRAFDVVVTDLMLETNDAGLEVLRAAKQERPETEVVLMTAFNGVETAVEAMLEGAFNYLQKPLDLKRLRSIVQKAGDATRLRRVNRQLKERLDEKFGFDGVVGGSPAMLKTLERLKRIAPTDATVLILGETGTGKELFAQALHQNSPRKNKPFVALNCAALSEHLLESELFGHVKGAFTDATSDRVGKFEYANGGTIFLDEVGDMSPSTQVKLLRVLENREITPVGSNKTIKVNVRLVSATNRKLEEAVEKGFFRADLYHRLKVVTLKLPSLKERAGDVPILLDHFMKIFAKKYGKSIKGVTQAARRKLFLYDWPGNVRELRNVAESVVVVDFDGLIDVDDLPDEILDATPNSTAPLALPTPERTLEPPTLDVSFADAPTVGVSETLDASVVSATVAGSASVLPSSSPGSSVAVPNPAPLDSARSLKSLVGVSLDELERVFILETLRSTGGNREETAKILGLGERTLYRRLKEFAQTDAAK